MIFVPFVAKTLGVFSQFLLIPCRNPVATAPGSDTIHYSLFTIHCPYITATLSNSKRSLRRRRGLVVIDLAGRDGCVLKELLLGCRVQSPRSRVAVQTPDLINHGARLVIALPGQVIDAVQGPLARELVGSLATTDAGVLGKVKPQISYDSFGVSAATR